MPNKIAFLFLVFKTIPFQSAFPLLFMLVQIYTEHRVLPLNYLESALHMAMMNKTIYKGIFTTAPYEEKKLIIFLF
jgi:hypothetical protein